MRSNAIRGSDPPSLFPLFRRHHMDINGWFEDRDANRRTAVDLARRALLVAGDDPDVLAYGGFALGYFGEDISRRHRALLRPTRNGAKMRHCG